MSQSTAVHLVGNLTRDPELKFTVKGTAVVNFSIAVNHGPEKVGYYDVTAWDTLATNVAESLSKGMRCVVFGALDHSTWQTPEGQSRSKVQVVAEAVGPDLRFATANVQRTPKAVPAAQQQYPTDTEWAEERVKQEALGGPNWREEPF